MAFAVVLTRLLAALHIVRFGPTTLCDILCSKTTLPVARATPVVPPNACPFLLPIQRLSPPSTFTSINDISAAFGPLGPFHYSPLARSKNNWALGSRLQVLRLAAFDRFGFGTTTQLERPVWAFFNTLSHAHVNFVTEQLINIGILSVLALSALSLVRNLTNGRSMAQGCTGGIQKGHHATSQLDIQERTAVQQAEEQCRIAIEGCLNATNLSREYQEAYHILEIELRMEQLERGLALERANNAEAALAKIAPTIDSDSSTITKLQETVANLEAYADEADAARISAYNAMCKMREELASAVEARDLALEKQRNKDMDTTGTQTKNISAELDNPSLMVAEEKYKQEIESLKTSLKEVTAAKYAQVENASIIRRSLWRKLDNLNATIQAQNEEIKSLRGNTKTHDDSSSVYDVSSYSESWSIDYEAPVLPDDLQPVLEADVTCVGSAYSPQLSTPVLTENMGLPTISDVDTLDVSAPSEECQTLQIPAHDITPQINGRSLSFTLDQHPSRSESDTDVTKILSSSILETPTTPGVCGPELPSTPKFKPRWTSSPLFNLRSPTVVPALLLSPRLPLRDLNFTIYPLSPTAHLGRSKAWLRSKANVDMSDDQLDENSLVFTRS